MKNDKYNFSELFNKNSQISESTAKQYNSVSTDDCQSDIPHVSRKFAVSIISLFVTFLLLPSILWGILKIANHFDPGIMEAINFDTGENRAFAKFPTSFNAKTVTSDIEAWYNDNLPFRSVLYSAQANIESKLEAPYNNTLQPALIKLFHPSVDTDEPIGGGAINIETSPDQTTPPEENAIPEYDNDEELYADCIHLFSADSTVVREATCIDWGIIGYSCSKCEYIQKEYTQKADHDYISNATTKLSCGTNFEETFTCSLCADSYIRMSQKKHTQKKILKKVEPSYEDYGYTLLECADCGCEYRSELYDKLYDTTYFPTSIKNGTVIGRSGWLFQDKTLPYYSGTNILTTAELEEYANTFEELDELCKKKGIEFLVVIWPNKELIYSEYMPTTKIVDEYSRAERLVDYVSENTDVNIIYPVEELNAAKPYFELYLPLDTHWNRAGAFVGYQTILKALGLETTELVNLPVKQVVGGGTDLHRQAGLLAKDYPPQKNYNVTYRPDVKVTYKYGDPESVSGATYTVSNGKYDKTVMLIGDSYRLMHKDYIQRDFKSCIMGHKNYLTESPITNEIKNTDILILTSVEKADSDLLSSAKNLIKLLSR